MKKASVTLSLTLNFDTNEDTTKERIEGIAYWLIQPFIEQFVNSHEFDNNTTIEDFSVNVEEQYTAMGVSVPNYVAEQIELEDDGQPHGGISYIGETLDNFIQETRDFFEQYGAESDDDEFIYYDIPLGVINGGLEECGIKKLTPEDIDYATEKAAKTMTDKEYAGQIPEIKAKC